MVPVCWCCQRCRSAPPPEHRGFGSGCIDHPRDVHGMIVERVWSSPADLGVHRLVVWRGCGGHALRQAVARLSTRYADRARAFLPELSYHAIWCRIGDAANPGGHADALATSLALHLQPDTVRREVLAWPPQSPVDQNNPRLDFGRHSASGVIGDPTPARAELGASLWRAIVDEAAQMLPDFARPEAGAP